MGRGCFARDAHVACPIVFPFWPNVTFDGLSSPQGTRERFQSRNAKHPSVPFNSAKCSITLGGERKKKKVSTKDNIWLLDVCARALLNTLSNVPALLAYILRRHRRSLLHKPRWSENRHGKVAVECSCNPRSSHNDIKTSCM